VPMYDRNIDGMRDVVMPGINLYRTQASRSGAFAGMTEPEFGPDRTDKIGGQEITYPEWCRVTAKRQLANGAVAEFTAREFWIENYAVKGGKEKSIAPNAMWTKRPRGQIAKCAAAQALRIAFPEIASQPTAEEMEGKSIHVDEMVVEATPARPAPIPWPDEAFSMQFPRWEKAVQAGMKTPDDILALARSKGDLSPAQEAQIAALRKAEAPAAEVVEAGPTWGDDAPPKGEPA
jgi:phage recombination protein Bet